MNSVQAYALSKRYVSETLDGNGALRGNDGKPFTVSKTFSSITEMQEDNTVENGDYVVISSTVDDEDNAKLYKKIPDGYEFITDMSGSGFSPANADYLSKIGETDNKMTYDGAAMPDMNYYEALYEMLITGHASFYLDDEDNIILTDENGDNLVNISEIKSRIELGG